MRVHLKGVKKVTAKLATGETKVYYYAWNGGPRLEGKPGSPEFVHSYTIAQQARKTPSQGTLFTLISEFRASAEFTGTSGPTQRNYRRYLRLIEEEFGDLPLRALLDPEIRGEFKRWRDKLADKPRTADYAWTTLARVLSFAKDRGRITINPCAAGGRLYKADRIDKVWGEAEIANVLSVAPQELELALIARFVDWTATGRFAEAAVVRIYGHAHSAAPVEDSANRRYPGFDLLKRIPRARTASEHTYTH
jgi:hypothetical protein